MEGIEEGTNGRGLGTSSAVVDDSWFQFCNGSNPWMARNVYGLIFLAVNMLAWAVRDYGRSALTEIKRLKECRGGKDYLGAEGVLRVSLGCFTFYVIMFLSTVGTSKMHRPREQWHFGWWIAKICFWVVLIVLSFLVPPVFVRVYGQFHQLSSQFKQPA